MESMPVSNSEQGLKSQNEAKRSHGDQPLYNQWDPLRTTKTKPRRPSSVTSIVYGDFAPVFSQVATDDATLYIADLGNGMGVKTKPKQSHRG